MVLGVVGVLGCIRHLTYVGARRVPQESLEGLHAPCSSNHDCNEFQRCQASPDVTGSFCEIPCENSPGVFDDLRCPAPRGCYTDRSCCDSGIVGFCL